MQVYTVLLLAMIVAAAAAAATHYDYEALSPLDDADAVGAVDPTEHQSSPRTKRGLFLLKKKLLLGLLGIKAAKLGAIGVAGALALKSKAAAAGSLGSFGGSKPPSYGASGTAYGYSSSGPAWNVQVRSW